MKSLFLLEFSFPDNQPRLVDMVVGTQTDTTVINLVISLRTAGVQITSSLRQSFDLHGIQLTEKRISMSKVFFW